jgi:hypothetical protein
MLGRFPATRLLQACSFRPRRQGRCGGQAKRHRLHEAAGKHENNTHTHTVHRIAHIPLCACSHLHDTVVMCSQQLPGHVHFNQHCCGRTAGNCQAGGCGEGRQRCAGGAEREASRHTGIAHKKQNTTSTTNEPQFPSNAHGLPKKKERLACSQRRGKACMHAGGRAARPACVDAHRQVTPLVSHPVTATRCCAAAAILARWRWVRRRPCG